MSQLAQVAEIAGVSTADVVRVATRGGTTAADWDIAHAIEAAGGRPAADTMWGPTHVPGTDTAPAPANPKAKHDRTVRIYEEPTAPDAPQTVLPDHPHEDPEPEEAERSEAEAFAASVHRSLVRYSRSRAFASHAVRVVASAASLAAARRTLYTVLARDPRTSLFGLHPEPVALAA